MKTEVNHNNLPEFVGQIFNQIAELRHLIRQCLPESPRPQEKLLSKDAIEHLKVLGYHTTIYNLNKICCQGRLDGTYEIIGGRRVFTRAKLTQWVQMGCPNMRELQTVDRLAATLNK